MTNESAENDKPDSACSTGDQDLGGRDPSAIGAFPAGISSLLDLTLSSSGRYFSGRAVKFFKEFFNHAGVELRKGECNLCRCGVKGRFGILSNIG